MKKRLWIGIAGLCLLLLLGCMLAYHSTKDATTEESPDERARRLAQPLIDRLTPPKASKEAWSGVKASKGSLAVGEAQVEFTYFLNLKPLLEADTNANVFHMKFVLSRQNGTPCVTVASIKAPYILNLDTSKHSVSRQKNAWAGREPPGSEVVSETYLLPERSLVEIRLGTNPKNRSERVIGFYYPRQQDKRGTRREEILPYPLGLDHGGPFLAFTDYPIGVAVRKRNEAAISLILCDVFQARVLCEVPLPKELSGLPYFILDRSEDVLLASNIDYNAVALIDLRSCAQHVCRQANRTLKSDSAGTVSPEPKPSGHAADGETIVAPLIPIAQMAAAMPSGDPVGSKANASAATVPYGPKLIVYCSTDNRRTIYHLTGCGEIRPEDVALPIVCLSRYSSPCPICRPPECPPSEAGQREKEEQGTVIVP